MDSVTRSGTLAPAIIVPVQCVCCALHKFRIQHNSLALVIYSRNMGDSTHSNFELLLPAIAASIGSSIWFTFMFVFHLSSSKLPRQVNTYLARRLGCVRV